MIGFKPLLALIIYVLSAPAVGAGQPNIVFFLVDDLGWSDLGCYGSEFHRTPNIDQLCESGMKFNRAYAASPVCSPTRASILTGRHPVRVDITDWIPGLRWTRQRGANFKHVNDRDDLALSEVTMAEVFKSNGYATFFAGKWHLGGGGHLPTDQGFDFNIGGNRKGSPPGGYYSPWKNPALKAQKENEYVTERLTQESVKFIESNSAEPEPKPFFLFLSYYNVHTPITPYRKRIDEFRTIASERFSGATPSSKEHDARTRLRQDNAAYASMVAAVDDSVGEILQALEKTGIDDETIICFFSDNGGLSTLANNQGPTCNLPLRSGKGWLYEGGIREPMIIRAPGVTVRKSTCEQPVVSMDFFPTLLELAGIEKAESRVIDGKSLVPILSREPAEEFNRRTLYWHYPHYHGSGWKPGAAILEGNWKLIEFYHHEKMELYDIENDVGEKIDLADKMPAKAKDLRRKLNRWQRSMKARMPEKLD